MATINFESIVIELTKKCNLTCSYCYAIPSNIDSSVMLGTKEIKDFLSNFHSAGGRSVLLSGGEIFLREDIEEIILHANEVGLSVDIFTNGTLLKEHDVEFIKENVNLVSISLDGPEEHHDKVRGVKGSYKRTMETLELFKKHEVKYLLQSMVTPENINNLDWLVDIIRNLDPLIVKLGNVCKVGKGKDKKDLLLSEEEIMDIKRIAGEVCERANHFHTRVVTNIVTNKEFKIFYPSVSSVITPWMLPNGRILSCYTNEDQEFWTLSTHKTYPCTTDEALIRRNNLVDAAYNRAKDNNQFEFLELVSEVAVDIIREYRKEN